MKVAVPATGESLDAEVDSRFGRCPFFLIVDTDSMNFESIRNESAGATGGAGIQAAQFIAQKGVDAVIAINIGPNAFQTLRAAGLRVFIAEGTISSAVERCERGELSEMQGPNRPGHFGMGRGGGGRFDGGRR